MTVTEMLYAEHYAHIKAKGRDPDYFLIEPRLYEQALCMVDVRCDYFTGRLVFNNIPLIPSTGTKDITSFSYPKAIG